MTKKLLTVALVAMMSLSIFANGNSESQSSSSKESEKIKMVIHLNGVGEDIKLQKAIAEVQTMDKYSNVEFEVHGREADYLTAVPIAIAGGEQKDVVVIPNPMIQQQWATQGAIVPLDEYAKKAGVDFEKEYGPYAENAMNNGNYYIVPQNKTSWVLYYNKDIFDKAGVAYPDPITPMTWDEYRELAKKVTMGTGANKIYGAFYLTWGTFWYGDAIMNLGGGEHFYTEDGLSNIEDPAFAEAMERTYNMMHVDKSMPTHANVKTSKIGATAFMNGKYAMDIQGGWVLPWAVDKENFPRTWKLGVAPMPVHEGTTPMTWGIVNGFAVSPTSADPQLAFDIAMDLSRLSAKYAESSPSADVLVAQDNLFVGLEDDLAEDNITVDELNYLFAGPDVVAVTEKIIGKNNVQYEKVITEEVEKYLVQEQSVEETIQNIKTRGDKVIKAN
jgi:multiple sugar transport system substrate-binding protein